MSLFKKLTKLERVNENIDAKQKSVDQLGATENPRKIKVLDTDQAPAHPFDGKLVGEEAKQKSLRNPRDNPCWKGYKPVGTKQKDGRTVPNCVPKEGVAEGSVNDYFKRRKDEEDRIAGIKAPAKRTPRQTDYAKRRAQEKKVDQGVAEGSENPYKDINLNAWHLIQGDKPIAINFPDEYRAKSFHSGHGYGRETQVLHGSQVRRNAYLKHNPGAINWPEYSKDVAEGYTGRETKDGVWRVFKDGKAVAVAGPFKTREEAAAWIKKQKQGVAEGSFGSGYGSVFTLYVNTGEKPATKTKTKKFKREDDAVLWAEDYADQHEMFPNLKMEIQDENGNVVWELEESQGVAEASEQYYAIVHKVTKKPLSTHRDLESAKDEWRGLDRDQRPFYAVMATKKKPEDWSISEGDRNEMDTPEFRAALAGLKKKAQQGPTKTVYDPKTGKYKVVPVKSDTPVKESAYDYTIEDVISKLKDRLGDYLTDVAQAVKKDTDLKEPGSKPSDTINAVKTLVTDDGHEIRIHGNEDDGFRITIKNKDSKAKFANLKEAEMAARAYCARRKNQMRVPKNFENEK